MATPRPRVPSDLPATARTGRPRRGERDEALPVRRTVRVSESIERAVIARAAQDDVTTAEVHRRALAAYVQPSLPCGGCGTNVTRRGISWWEDDGGGNTCPGGAEHEPDAELVARSAV